MKRNHKIIEQSIVSHLKKNREKSFKQRKLARDIGMHSSQYQLFKKILRSLCEEGKVERLRKNFFRLPNPLKNVIGTIEFHGKGFGFVMTENNEEIFIGGYDGAPAFSRDTVLVEKYSRQFGKNPEGRVIKVIKRSNEPVFGIIKRFRGEWIAIPESPIPAPHISVSESYEGILEGQMVELTKIQWDDSRMLPRAEIKQILGIPDNPRDDLMIIKKMFRLRDTFPKRVEDEAEKCKCLKISSEAAKRCDFRDKLVFTIDPAEAKDYDDAVSLEEDNNDNWLLGVHISDVSEYVQQWTAVDQEARKRGTSIYFYEDTIPMLPKKLSNELCSLQPDMDKITLSVLITISQEGEIHKFQIVPSIIRSKKRFTYSEVQEILDRSTGLHYEILDKMRNLSQILFKKRSEMGSIDFDIPEPTFKLDSNGVPTEIKPSERLESHRLIEEFMLLANRCVAEWVAVHHKSEKIPFIYRIHEQPSEDSVDGLYYILNHLGMNLNKPKKFTSKDLSSILREVSEMPFKHFVEQISLRSMSKAFYSQKPAVHFGLAFRHYTHFTSPVRRYPDLLAHRLIKLYLGSYNDEDISFYRRSIPKVAQLCSENEIRALKVEREYIRIKQIRFLSGKIGRWFSGIVTGVVESGFFVELSNFLIEGFVHVRTLYDDYYVYDKEKYSLTGKRHKRNFQLGDVVKVKVINASVIDRRVDLEWGE